jgi:hypothetical protein
MDDLPPRPSLIFPWMPPTPVTEVWHDGQRWGRSEIGPGEWIEDLDGIGWYERPAPRRWHRCRPATRALLDGRVTERSWTVG